MIMMQHRLGIRSGLVIYQFTLSHSLSLISYLVLSPQNLVTWSHYTHRLSLTISVGQEFRVVVLTSVSHDLVVKWWLGLGSSWRLLQSHGLCWLGRLDQRELGLFLHLCVVLHAGSLAWTSYMLAQGPKVHVPRESTRQRLFYLLLPIFGSNAVSHLDSLSIKGKEHRCHF